MDDARKFYAMTAMAFMKGEKCLFYTSDAVDEPTGGTADPDLPFQPPMKGK